jgi:tetratricopeptide (TPR) repeat protein
MKNAVVWSILIFILSGVLINGNENSGTYLKNVVIKRSADLRKDTARINELVSEGIRYLNKPVRIEKVKSCIDSAILLCEKQKVEIPSLLHLLIADYNYYTGDLRSASEEASLALKKSTDNNEFKILAKTNIFLGKYYQRTGMFKESIECFEKAISISDKKGIKGLIPRSYLGQAFVYEALGDLKSSRKNYLLMIKAGFNEKDSAWAAEGYYRLGTSYCGDSVKSARRNFIRADSILRESIRISLIRKDTNLVSLAYANTGWNFYLEKMYDSSLINYNRSLRYSLPGKKYSASSNSLGNIGTIYRDLGEYEKSIKYYNKAINQGKVADDVYNLRWIYEDMSKLYLVLNDTSNAFLSYIKFKKFSDAYLNRSSTQGLADARIRYEADSHRKEVELLSLRLKNNRLLNYGLTGLAILTIAIVLLLYRGSQLKNKRSISEMNQKISEITQANLRQQMNPHFIFNTLNSIQYYMYQHDKLSTNNYLTKFSNLMRKVLDNSQHTSVPLSEELSALKLYLELESIRFKDKFDFEIDVDEDIDPLMYKVPTMLIQPYVENSICHGLIPMEGKGIVRIDLILKENYILCTIEDNGIGREAARERNHKREKNHNSLGTQITKSRLDLVNELYGTSLKIVYTDLKNESGNPAGTKVEIHIPIMT